MAKVFEPIKYQKEYELLLVDFLEKCLPESGRVLDINGRHSFYKDIKNCFKEFWCMFDQEKVIGTAAIKELNDKSCELKSLYLLEKYHGRGYGKCLLEEAITHAKELGYEKIYLDSLSTSKKAISLYRKAGFVDTERYNQNEYSDVFMVLDLMNKGNNMRVIETNGITYLEKLDENEEWYWGTNYTSGDLYEAEEIFLSGKHFEPNRLIFVHYPDGKVFEPIRPKENNYFGRPAFIDGRIYILLVSFDEKVFRVFQCSQDMCEVNIRTEIPLNEVVDCYNLRIDGDPVMVTRQGGDNHFQIIWPEKVDFIIGERESFFFRKDERLYFSEWHEDPEYREEINIREYPSGNLVEKIPGTIMAMPNKENWVLR